MAKAEATVQELVDKIQRGELRLPEMQRRYVWQSTRVRDLLDSLYRGYPSGAILVWESSEPVPEQAFAVGQAHNPYASTQLLLDGQQRLTSLSAVIRGEPVQVRGRKRPIEVLFNLDHPEDHAVITEVDDLDADESADSDEDADEEDDDTADATDDELMQRFKRMTFVVATRKLASQPGWVRVSEVFKESSDAPFLKQAGVQNFDDPRYQRYTKRLAKLRDIRKYVYRMDILERSLSYDEVTEIFVRVNSLGAKLRSSDLALAQITAKWRGSLQVFLKFQEACAKQGFELVLGIHLRNLVVFASGQSRFRSVHTYSVSALQDAWAKSCDGMNFAINFMRSNAGISNPVLLSSPFVLIVLAYFFHTRSGKIGAEEAAQLVRWVRLANAKGRFSRGSSETLVDQDIATLRDGGTVDVLVERLRQQVGRLDITPEELNGRNQRSALFKTMFLAFRAAGAKDWATNLAIDVNHAGAAHRLEFHHIFPKATLKATYSGREVDDIANLAFISSKTNNHIKDKLVSSYLPELVKKQGSKLFEDQAIPLDEGLLALESYRSFLQERRKRIAKMLNTYLDVDMLNPSNLSDSSGGVASE
jgi:hypothetical protein